MQYVLIVDIIGYVVGNRVEFQFATSYYCQPKILLGTRHLGTTIISRSDVESRDGDGGTTSGRVFILVVGFFSIFTSSTKVSNADCMQLLHFLLH